jgi:hypothetical protein
VYAVFVVQTFKVSVLNEEDLRAAAQAKASAKSKPKPKTEKTDKWKRDSQALQVCDRTHLIIQNLHYYYYQIFSNMYVFLTKNGIKCILTIIQYT